MPAAPEPLTHDSALFDALLARATRFHPDIRRGSMFGGPAIYVGRRMAICVHGAELGLRVPEDLARKSIDDGRARPFRPYAKAQMREWIALGGGPDALHASDDLLRTALTFAETKHAG